MNVTEGIPIMDDRANDGRGARMASEGEGLAAGIRPRWCWHRDGGTMNQRFGTRGSL
jgi:hypothetical protein